MVFLKKSHVADHTSPGAAYKPKPQTTWNPCSMRQADRCLAINTGQLPARLTDRNACKQACKASSVCLTPHTPSTMHLRNALHSTLAAIFLTGVPAAASQGADSHLWIPMREIVFNSINFASTGTEEERQILQQIWSKELSAHLSGNSKELPAFTLVGDARDNGKRIIFTMFDAAGSDRCETAENGASAHDIFVLCRMRVLAWPMLGYKFTDLPNYCMLRSGGDKQNRVEYFYDKSQKMVKFRTIQYGKLVQNCSRALKLG